MTLHTLALPKVGSVKITGAVAQQLKAKSLVAPLGNKLFPAAGKSADLVGWLDLNAQRHEPTGTRKFPRYSM